MIICRDLNVRYPGTGRGQIPALNGLSVTISDSEFTAVIGPNGSGKSTFALAVSGLLSYESGSITVNDRNVKDLVTEGSIRDIIGIVFQNPDNQLLTNSLEREIAIALENRGVPRDVMLGRVDSALERFNLKDLLHLQPEQLSGGQKQKLALASILVADPDYLILDETTSYLDPKDRKMIFSMLRNEYKRKSSGKFSIVLITQFVREAVQSDRVIVMNKGAVAADAPPERLFIEHKTLLDSIGIEAPAEYQLKAAFPEIDIPSGLLSY
ncbi:ATP-binding cassette domain-containing protein [candidate division KSB1 bacterium]